MFVCAVGRGTCCWFVGQCAAVKCNFMCIVLFVKTMGSSLSTKSESPPPEGTTLKTNNVRSSIRTKQPMPDAIELERRFAKVLVSVNQELLKFNNFSYIHVEKLLTGARGCSQTREVVQTCQLV